MKRLLRNITRVMLIMALGVGGLGFVATTAAPVAHAAGPTLYATSLSNGISLYGYGFTDGAPVGITVYEAICKGANCDFGGSLPVSTPYQCGTPPPDPSCVLPFNDGFHDGFHDGFFSWFMPIPRSNYQGSVYVLASQAGGPLVGATEWSQPHHLAYDYNDGGVSLQVQQGSYPGPTLTVSGSGFDSNATVYFQVNNYQAHCFASFTVTASGWGTIPPSTTLPNDGNGVLCGGQTTVHAYEINNRPGEPWQLYDAGAQVFVGE